MGPAKDEVWTKTKRHTVMGCLGHLPSTDFVDCWWRKRNLPCEIFGCWGAWWAVMIVSWPPPKEGTLASFISLKAVICKGEASRKAPNDIKRYKNTVSSKHKMLASTLSDLCTAASSASGNCYAHTHISPAQAFQHGRSNPRWWQLETAPLRSALFQQLASPL